MRSGIIILGLIFYVRIYDYSSGRKINDRAKGGRPLVLMVLKRQ